MPGVNLQDVWTDIDPINSRAAERLGYPTQKPITLLERIIRMSSNTGDVVLDPFCGCGTTIDAAQNLGRAWIGIDITFIAVDLIEKRLVSRFPGIAGSYEMHGYRATWERPAPYSIDRRSTSSAGRSPASTRSQTRSRWAIKASMAWPGRHLNSRQGNRFR